mgnify:CR=1 FL=1
MNLPETVEVKGLRVLTSGQIAECYGTTLDCIKQNFHANRNRYVEGKHYIALSGDELKEFKDWVRKAHLVNNQVRITNLVGKQASHLYLWTEKGALLHAKSLNTDKAWEVYDYLVDFYFRAKEKQQPPRELTYREKREAALAEIHARESEKKKNTAIEQKGYDIAPDFRRVISVLPIEALDEMEKVFRGNKNQAIKLAGTSILAEKMKRQLA